MIWIWLALALGAGLTGVAAGYMLGLGRGRLQSEAERGHAEAIVDDRLGSLGVLAAGVVHEIAQPLSAARVSVEGLHYLRQLGRPPTEKQLDRAFDRVGMSLLMMAQILDHLRYLAGNGAARSGMPVALRDAVAGIVADRANWLRWSDVPIEVAVHGSGHAQADLVGLRLIVTNLVRNAAEAVSALSPDRRWLRIEVGDGDIAICDPGPGVAPELAGELFKPFVSSRGEARGFGLSLAQAAAQRMRGTLAYRRDHAAGVSIFTLTLPTIDPPASAGPAA